MRRKLWIGAIALCIVAGLAIGVSALLRPAPGLTFANFSRIDTGMTRAEVVAVLGPPSMAILRGDIVEDLRIFDDGKVIPNSYYWRRAKHGQAQVHFDKNDRVTDLYWDGWHDDRNAMEKLRDRLPWIAKEPPKVNNVIF
jgi:outer membrane protein assembly factor BamE (lipoprotein component of BamABCDE complex)